MAEPWSFLSMYAGSALGRGSTGELPTIWVKALNQVGAATVPPKAPLAPAQLGLACTGSVPQIGSGVEPSANTMDEAAQLGRMPRKPTERLVSVVPVLPAIGRVQCALRAAATEVPEMVSSLRPF